VVPVPFGRIGTHSLKDGRLAEIYRVRYQDTIDALEQPAKYKQAYILYKALVIDGEPATMKDVMDMDNNDAEKLLKALFAAMAK
jgi:hypothetical protein